jgi:elongator complex protein 1
MSLLGQLMLELDLDMEEGNKVMAIQYVPDTESVVVATWSGDILAIIALLSPKPELDCIGSIETGIESMSWSPDFEVVLFTTRAETLLMMTQEWDTIFEQPIIPDNEAAQVAARLAISEPSKIKLETTINDVKRVSEAKTLVTEQMEQAKDFVPMLAHVGQNVITWRGDGQFFAVSSPNTEEKESVASQFRVYERSGKFFTKSESGVLTQSVLLAWKPSGDVLASTQSLPTHDEVIFFEKNGLRHYEFKIHPEHGRIIDLQWNASSDILSTLVRLPNHPLSPMVGGMHRFSDERTFSSHTLALQLWSTKNYHWYLKQEFLFHDNHVSVNWDAENGMQFTVTTEDGEITQHTICWDTDISRGTQSHPVVSTPAKAHQPNSSQVNNHSVAAVIDGTQLLLSALRYQVIPPPMSTVTIKYHTAINQVAFDLANNFMVFGSDGTVALYEHYKPELTPGQPPRYNVLPKFLAKCKPGALDSNLRQFVLIGNDELLCVSAQRASREDVLMHLRFHVVAPVSNDDNSPPAELHFEILEELNLKARVSRIVHNADTGSTYLQYTDSMIAQYDVMEKFAVPRPELQIGPGNLVCPWLASATFADGEESLIGLTSGFKLFAGGVMLSTECNSFALHSDYLLFSTLTHRLRTVTLHKSVQENISILAPKPNIKFDDSSREIEQGAIIISVSNTRVVLQMPRGNLEAIEPRSLVLHSIRNHLDNQEYKQAFEMMRKQRINLNFFYDHNPSLFMEHIASFLDQTPEIDHLNLFISSLTSEDCTKTTYVDVFGHTRKASTVFHSAASIASSSTANPAPTKLISAKAAQYIMPIHTEDAAIKARLVPLKIGKDKINSLNKVNHVCDTLRSLMEKKDAEKYLLPILTTLVCKDPPEIEKALLTVQRLRKSELEASGASSTTTMSSSMTSEKALKYLVFLVDVNRLYDIALGMYDFDLVILVAQKSQKDPREYLPFLADLQKQDQFYQRYSIDAHLAKWESALVNLSKAGTERFNECLALIEKRNLYNFALTVFQGEERNSVLEIYGDHLHAQKAYAKAILAYRSGNKLQKAFETAKCDSNWRQAVALGHQLGIPTQSPEDWTQHLNDLATLCHDRFKYEDAATVLEQLLGRPTEALAVLLEGYLWDHAQLLCHKHGLSAKIETDLVPAALAAQQTILTTIQEKTVKLSKYHNRLITVRANKYLQAQSESMPMIEGSETSSMYSGSSQSSSASSSTKKSAKSSKSAKSNKSSRSSRSASKGKVSGRKGSPHEEQFLVQEIPGLLPPLRIQQEVSDLLAVLFQFGHSAKAVELQKALDEWISRGSKALNIINTPSPLTREEQQDFDASRQGADLLQLALVDPPKIPNATLKPIDWRLSLLDDH